MLDSVGLYCLVPQRPRACEQAGRHHPYRLFFPKRLVFTLEMC